MTDPHRTDSAIATAGDMASNGASLKGAAYLSECVQDRAEICDAYDAAGHEDRSPTLSNLT